MYKQNMLVNWIDIKLVVLIKLFQVSTWGLRTCLHRHYNYKPWEPKIKLIKV